METQPPAAKVPELLESEEEHGKVIELLEERLEKHNNNRKVVQDKLHGICEGLRSQIDELENRINKELEEKFTFEDDRLQTALNKLRENRTASVLQKTRAELLIFQSYELIDNNFESKLDLTTLYDLKAERRIVSELIKVKKPTDVRVTGVDRGMVSVQFTFFNPDEERVLSGNPIVNPIKYKCSLFKKGNKQESRGEYPLDKNEVNGSSSSFSFTFTPDILEAGTTYGIRVKIMLDDRESAWSDEIAEFTTPEFRKCCVWKTCPGDVNRFRKYSVDERNPRVATKIDYGDCTIIGNTYIPLNKVTSWDIKILKSRNNGYCIFIGVAQNDINQNDSNDKCGWYFHCYYSTLSSGPPHNYYDKEYGPRKEEGEYVQTGDSVGVVVDTTKGDLSFVLNEVNLGVAYEGIPLDKPLVPCVILGYSGDSVELI